MVTEHRPHVVIVGGGFGGLRAVRALKRASVTVTLVDRHNYHLFQPLLYQVATAALSPGDIASPIRWVLRKQKNVQVLLAEARAIDAPGHRVILDRGDESISGFFERNASRELNEQDQVTVIKLMEMQRHAMLMYTSCGWFFDEVSGLESV